MFGLFFISGSSLFVKIYSLFIFGFLLYLKLLRGFIILVIVYLLKFVLCLIFFFFVVFKIVVWFCILLILHGNVFVSLGKIYISLIQLSSKHNFGRNILKIFCVNLFQ